MFGIDPIELLQSYGYLALLVGTFLEGETIVIIAGFLAQQDLLFPPYIALAAFCGSFCSDQLMFTLGRWKGMEIIQRFPRLEKNMGKAMRLLSRYETPLILGFRFIYGVRNVTPILMGVSGVNWVKFFTLNFIGAVVWSISFTAAGYFCGQAVTSFMETAPHAGRYVLMGLAAVIALVWFWRRSKKKAAKQAEEASKAKLCRTILPPDTAESAATPQPGTATAPETAPIPEDAPCPADAPAPAPEKAPS